MVSALYLVFAAAALAAIWAVADANRRALAVLLVERSRARSRALPWGLSLAALFSGPLSPLLGVILLSFLIVRRRHSRDPFDRAAQKNAWTALVVGAVFLAAPFALSWIAPT